MYVKKKSPEKKALTAYWNLLCFMAQLCENPISRICKQIVSFFPAGIGTQDVFDVLCLELTEGKSPEEEFNIIENSYDPEIEHYYDWMELLIYYGAPATRKYLYEVYGQDAHEQIFKDVEGRFERRWFAFINTYKIAISEMENMLKRRSEDCIDDFLRNKYYALLNSYSYFSNMGPIEFAKKLINEDYISGRSIRWQMDPQIVQLTEDSKIGIMVKHDYDHMMVYRNRMI